MGGMSKTADLRKTLKNDEFLTKIGPKPPSIPVGVVLQSSHRLRTRHLHVPPLRSPTMKTKTILLAVLSVLLPVAAHSGSCGCVVSDNYQPKSVTISPCQSEFSFDVSAPITCSTPHRAKEKLTVRPKQRAGRPYIIPVTLVGYCVHTNEKSKVVDVQIEFDDSLKDGDIRYGVSSVDVTLSLGYDSSRHMAGRLQLFVENPTPGIYRQSALRLTSSRLRDIVSIPDGRQFLADQCFAVVTNAGDNAFDAVFYPRSAARMGYIDTVTNGTIRLPSGQIQSVLLPARIFDCYVVDDPNAFKVRYRFSNPSPGSCSALRIVETRPGGRERTIDYTWNGNRWSLVEGGGLRSRVVEYSDLENGRLSRETLSSSAGGLSFVVERLLREIGGEERVLREVTDPDGLALTNRYEYFETGAKAGFVSREFRHDGSWAEYERLDDGRLSRKRSGWLAGGPEDDCRTVEYSYSPIRFASGEMPEAFPDDDGSVDPTTARVETESVGGVLVSKLLRHVTKDEAGYRRIEEVQLLDPSETNLVAAWTASGNPHRLSVYMPDSDFKPCSRLPSLVVEPDGSAAFYDYESGEYTPAADGTPGSFAVVRGGSVFRTTITHGTAASFDLDPAGLSTNGYAGVPLRGTREIRYETRIDKLEILRESYVCNATGGYERIAWTKTDRDADGNVVRILASDGTLVDRTWSDGLLLSETDENGIVHSFAYDGLGRQITSTYVDPLTDAENASSIIYDVAGRVLSSTTITRNLIQSIQHSYDGAGRIIWSCGPDGIETTTSYGTTNGLHFVATTRGADGLFTTSATYSYADGQTAYVERNGKRAQTYDYGYADGLQWTIAYEGPKGTNSPVWTASVSDALGRTIRELRPGFGGSILETSYAYNAAGQLLSSEEYTLSAETTPRAPRTPREVLALRSLREINPQPGILRSRTLNLYDSLGALRVSASDVNLNGTIDFAGPDIVSSNETAFAFLDSAWWRESSRYSFPDTDSAAPLRVSTTRTRLSGLGVSETTELGAALLAAETRSVDALGNVSSRKSYRNRTAHTAFNFSTSAASTLSAWSLSIGGHSVSNRTATGILSSRVYDALGRVIATTDGRGNTTTLAYDSAGRLASTTDATGATTAYGYDSLGRRTSVTNAIGLVTTTSYDLDNNITAQGGAQYPVWYSYDDYGRMRAMTTFRTEDLASGDVTTWHYDEATGLLVFKEYADGKGPTYDYTPEGRLSRRTWARGITTDYAYDGQGRLVAKTYSDATPAVSFAYDRLGHTISAICAGVSTNLYAYNRLGQLTNEVQNGTTISRTYDALGRATGYAIGDGEAVGSTVSYSYDTLGRFASVVSGTNTFSYSYLPGADLVSGLTANTGHAWERIYESNRDLIATVHNHYGNRTISRFDYTNDEIGRRVARVDSGEAFSETAFERYAYNNRSEVIGSQRFYGADTSDLSRPVTGRTFGYGYDPIGNRVSSFEDAGGQRLTTTYEANELNQYTAIQNPGAVPLRGDAKREAVVTVNGEQTERDNGTTAFTPWSYSLPSGATTAHFQNADILAVAQNAVGEDVEQRESGSVFVPAAETLLAYDDDGNMTFDGRFRYSWNGENRMIRAEEAFAPTNREPTVITYAYDGQGRMVAKNITGTNTVARTLIWDGYNIVRETENCNFTHNIWGLDLNGTFQGLGGVGGLLVVIKTNGIHLVCYDGNGNVSNYISPIGLLVSHYEYSPLGMPLVSFGEPFLYRFSTKPYCSTTLLLEYQVRLLSTPFGRWTSRDALEEFGGNNLLGFVNNNPMTQQDNLGLWFNDEDDILSRLDELLETAKASIDAAQRVASEINQFLSMSFLNDKTRQLLRQLSNMISYLPDCYLKMDNARQRARAWFRRVQKTYTCCEDGKAVPIASYPGENKAYADKILYGENHSHGVLHCATGYYASEEDADKVCLSIANLVFEIYEMVHNREWTFSKQNPIGWLGDTYSDVVHVFGGSVVNSVDKCIPHSCFTATTDETK